MDDIHDLAGAYALNALEEGDRNAFEAHLEGCEACQREVDAFADVTVQLAEASATTPPDSLRASVLDAIDAEPTPITSRRRGPLTAITAALAVAAVVVFGILMVNGGSSDIDAVLDAADAQTIQMDGSHGPAAFTFSPSLGQGVFHGENLVTLPSEQVYQLWVIASDAPVPSGTLTPDDNPELLVAGVAPGQTVAYTIEPAGGSQAPTTDPLAAAQL